MICDFAEQIAAPLLFTFHTVLAEPSDVQRRIMLNLIARATRIMVMSKHSREILSRVYGGPSTVIDVIENGAPDGRLAGMHRSSNALALKGEWC